jgi:hypothetical protein
MEASGELTCCANSGEILVLPRGGPPSRFAEATDELGPLPDHIVSSWTELFTASSEDVPDEARERNHALTSSPYVAVVSEDDVESELRRLREHPGVITATRNWSVSLASPLQDLNGVSVPATNAMQFLHDVGLLDDAPSDHPVRSVRVGVLDSGVDPGAISGNALEPLQLDTVALSSPIRTNPHDQNGHGSVVASIVNLMAPAASIFSVRCFGRGPSSLSDIVYGLLMSRLISEPIDIFNLSFSVDASTESCPACGHTHITGDDQLALRNLFDFLRTELDSQPVVVAAAGNHGGVVAVPAALDGVVAVGSVGRDSRCGCPTSSPAYRHLPPDFVLAPGGTRDDPIRPGLRLGTMSTPAFHGTSFATAVVTGLLARVLANGDRHGVPGKRDAARVAAVVGVLRSIASVDYAATTRTGTEWA